jgi:hypothetical protein
VVLESLLRIPFCGCNAVTPDVCARRQRSNRTRERIFMVVEGRQAGFKERVRWGMLLPRFLVRPLTLCIVHQLGE